MSVFDVAAYILRSRGEMTAMKLQKLVYYSQCWSLVWEERPLFEEQIQAWANGPVCPELYKKHRGLFRVGPDVFPGRPDELDDDARDTIDSVLRFYGEKDAQWLSDLTHAEDPWKEARKGLGPAERSDSPISHAAMAEYYGSL
ncbi:MAG: DUF4065 domain-containing protein [Marinibacterium sp.]|nr:DUF4065 domain-containing protein [Marinibacterium sp.]